MTPNTLLERAIARHAGVLLSQVKQLSDTQYFIDTLDPIQPLRDLRNHFMVDFSQTLVGTIGNIYQGE